MSKNLVHPAELELDTILDSFSNGQKKQMVEQIKEYGDRLFFIDLFDTMKCDYETFSRITYTYWWISK